MSDWGAVNDRVKGLEAGLELEMPSSDGVNDALIVQAVKDGSLKEDILDQAVERILRIIFEYADNRTPQEFTMEKDHEEARHIAEESMVLLKNDEQILPLKASEKIAFIGGFAKKPAFPGRRKLSYQLLQDHKRTGFRSFRCTGYLCRRFSCRQRSLR